MPNEVVFERSNRTILMILGSFLLVQVLVGIFQIRQVSDGSWTIAALIEFILLGLCFLVLLPYVMQRFIRFYPNGISYIRLFDRRFIEWGEITEVSNRSLNQWPIMRLAGRSKKVDIMHSEFADPDEVVRFTDQNLNAVNDERRRSLNQGGADLSE